MVTACNKGSAIRPQNSHQEGFRLEAKLASKLDSSNSSLTQECVKNLASRETWLLWFPDDTNLCQKLPLTHIGDCKLSHKFESLEIWGVKFLRHFCIKQKLEESSLATIFWPDRIPLGNMESFEWTLAYLSFKSYAVKLLYLVQIGLG